MAALVWFTVGVAIWHFTVFVPDRFWGGIVGAFLGAVTGAMITGAIAQIASGRASARPTSPPRSSRSPGPDRPGGDLRARRQPGRAGGAEAEHPLRPGAGLEDVRGPGALPTCRLGTACADIGGEFRPRPFLAWPSAHQRVRSHAPGRAFRLEPYSYAEVSALMEALALAEPVAVTLVRRGYRTVDEARAFLEAAEAHDPFEFDSMEEVTERICGAIADGRTITVHGDYDVRRGLLDRDPGPGAARARGASCDWYIPDRLGDGYGLTPARVERLAARGTRSAGDGRLRDHLRRRGRPPRAPPASR